MQGASMDQQAPSIRRLAGLLTAVAVAFALSAGPADAADAAGKERTSRLTDQAVFNADAVPPRPMRIELGDAYLGTGNISKGWTLPTGAVWNPSLLFYGLYRSAIQGYRTGVRNDPNCSNPTTTQSICAEWANRLDMNANLVLSGTERVVIGIRPFDENFTGPAATTGDFSGYYFTPGKAKGGRWNDATNIDLTMLFIEGEFAEIFPKLDPRDKYPLDIGFSVGRQQFFYQEGMLIFDFFDGAGVTKNQIQVPGASNLQVTFLFGWNEINRGDNIEVDDTDLYGVFFALDHPISTVNLDFVFVNDRNPTDYDGFFGGLSFVQRIGHFATAFRGLWSVATSNVPLRAPGFAPAPPTSVVNTGGILFAEMQWTPPWTHNNLYANGFVAIGNYTPAARQPGAGDRWDERASASRAPDSDAMARRSRTLRRRP